MNFNMPTSQVRFLIALAFLAGGTAALATEANQSAARPEVKSIAVYPAEAMLSSQVDHQSLVVQASLADGTTRDVTAEVEFALSQSAPVRRQGNVLHASADGTGSVTIKLAVHSVEVPITVTGATHTPPISFQLDVMPVFMKAGCNVGGCHGAASGKDGFRLSLFGYDPKGDYHRLTREISGRRINLAEVHESLLLKKSLGTVPHTGGKRFDLDSPYSATLVSWLEQGARKDPQQPPAVESVEIYPPGAVLAGPESTQSLGVRANYSDGTDRDVTHLAHFMTSNDNSATVDAQGVVTAKNRGEAYLMARFETHTVGVPMIILPADSDFAWQETAVNNYIDELMFAKLKKLRIQPSELCSDEEFLRRASLDIAGVLPTQERYEQFLSDDDPTKRENLVDELLATKEFVDLWVMKWAELLQIRTTQQISYKAMLRYYNWLEERIAAEMPMDELVKELLSASGGVFTNGASNYYENETDTLKIAENVAQVFMGMRIQCAQCHNHPFDRWTMNDYYSFAAFFSQIGRKVAEDPRERIIFNSRGGETKHPVTGQAMKPKFLGGATPDLAGRDRRVVLAQWLASPDNPYFARNQANIVWAHFFGRGILHEVDDVRVSNPPVDEELLQTLGDKLTEYRYDFKRLVRDICLSRTYQTSTTTNATNETDLTNFSHATLRRLRAEVMLDVISQVTQTKNKFQGLPLGARAVQIANGNTSTYFLTTFGRATRGSVCSCEVKAEPNLSQALHMLNGDTVHQKVQQGNLVGKWLEAGRTPEQIIHDLYVRCLVRPPTPEEKERLVKLVEEQENKKLALEDVFWGLLNSSEFVFNH